MLREIYCYLCHTSQVPTVYQRVGNYDLLQCMSCYFIWTDGVSGKFSDSLYQDETYYSEKGGSGFQIEGFQQNGMKDELSQFYMNSRLKPLLESILKFSRHKSGEIFYLDIGCSAGHLLCLAKEMGWKVEGVEKSPIAVEYAQKKLGLNVHEGSIEEAALPSDHYSAISFFHVLEHLNDPVESLRCAHRALRTDGVLAIEVPNIDSLPARIRSRSWHGYVLPYHLWHFSKSTLKNLLNQSGFKVQSIRTPFEPFSTAHILNVHRGLSTFKRRFKKVQVGIQTVQKPKTEHTWGRGSLLNSVFAALYWPTDQLMSRLGIGESIYVIASKK